VIVGATFSGSGRQAHGTVNIFAQNFYTGGTCSSSSMPEIQATPVPPIAANVVSAPLGALYAVPELPPHFLPRSDDLAKLRALVLNEGVKEVGIIGRALRTGVQGMGGIGKSVLAAALARDEEVRAAFLAGLGAKAHNLDLLDDAQSLAQAARQLGGSRRGGSPRGREGGCEGVWEPTLGPGHDRRIGSGETGSLEERPPQAEDG
jgi:hypothetical protein